MHCLREAPGREIGGAPFYVDADQYRRWGTLAFLRRCAPRPPTALARGTGGLPFIFRTP
jgi:hypothetical protein